MVIDNYRIFSKYEENITAHNKATFFMTLRLLRGVTLFIFLIKSETAINGNAVTSF